MPTKSATFLLALASLCLAAGARAGELKSQYTPLQNCPAVERLKLANRTLETSDRTGLFRCAGPSGFSVYVVDDDPRSFLVLERGGKLYSLERPMVLAFTLGNFPNVAGAKQAEWRLDGGAAAGLIVRVAYQRADGSAASTLMVFDLRGEPLLIGAAKTNEEARGLIDGALGAGAGAAAEERLSRECNAIYAGLCEGFAAGPEMLGRCADARPEIADKIPQKCVADFQTNVENYHEAKGAR